MEELLMPIVQQDLSDSMVLFLRAIVAAGFMADAASYLDVLQSMTESPG